MRKFVDIVERGAGTVVDSIEIQNHNDIDKVERGILINLDRDNFFTKQRTSYSIPTPHKSCRICQLTDERNEMEPRFQFVYCVTHSEVPPAQIDEAVRQFKTDGKTQWDTNVKP